MDRQAKRELKQRLFEYQWHLCSLCGLPMVMTRSRGNSRLKSNRALWADIDYEWRKVHPSEWRLAHSACLRDRGKRLEVLAVRPSAVFDIIDVENPTSWPKWIRPPIPPPPFTRTWFVRRGMLGDASEREALEAALASRDITQGIQGSGVAAACPYAATRDGDGAYERALGIVVARAICDGAL